MALNGGSRETTTFGDTDFLGAFTTGLRDVVAQRAAEVTPRSLGLDTLELIDRCYAVRRQMDEPWRALPALAS
jgi:hypothetical protein